MRLLSLSEASIQPRTSLPKFHKICQNLQRAAGLVGLGGGGPQTATSDLLPLAGAASVPASALRLAPGIGNFRRLVLDCIDASDSESRGIFQDFSKSTRSDKICILLHRFKLKISAKFRDFSEISAIFCKILENSPKFCKCLLFLRKFGVWSRAKECRSFQIL